MGFSNQEAINLNFASLAAGVIDANSSAVWFEKQFGFSFILGADTVWTQLASIPAAGNLTTARANATANPTLIQDLSQATSAKRLTLIAGTNDSTFACYSTYNDPSSGLLKNWLLPQLVPQSSGAPSNGYSIQLYDGDPNAGGTLITTTDGQTGTGATKQVGWIFNYALGLLLLSDDFFTRTGITPAAFNPYVVGFRYIGNTAGSAITSVPQTVSTLVADEAIGIGSLVRVVVSTDSGLTPGRVVNANASNATDAEVVGVALTAAGAQGDSLSVVTSGEADIKFASAPAASSNGQKVFLSTTDGTATLTPPTGAGQAIVNIGKLQGATGSDSTPKVLLNLQDPVLLG